VLCLFLFFQFLFSGSKEVYEEGEMGNRATATKQAVKMESPAITEQSENRAYKSGLTLLLVRRSAGASGSQGSIKVLRI